MLNDTNKSSRAYIRFESILAEGKVLDPWRSEKDNLSVVTLPNGEVSEGGQPRGLPTGTPRSGDTIGLRETDNAAPVKRNLYQNFRFSSAASGEGKHVTLHTFKDELKTKGNVELCKKSLSTFLKEIGFKYRKEDNRPALIKEHDIALVQSTFLKKYMANLVSSSAELVVFLDETWIYFKGNKIKSWQDDTIKSVRKPEGYDGKRFITVHAGSEQCFINGAILIFASNSKAAD
ncbi:hypothetical protein Trydic_g545 [Trypoxylus dichotomus]